MEPITRAKAARRPKTLDVRVVARKRAQAKARIAKRYSYHVRGMVAGTALVGLSVLFWILVAAVSLSSVVAGISTAVGAVYLGALTMMINVWQKYDAADRARIERYDAILAGARGTVVSSEAADEQAKGMSVEQVVQVTHTSRARRGKPASGSESIGVTESATGVAVDVDAGAAMGATRDLAGAEVAKSAVMRERTGSASKAEADVVVKRASNSSSKSVAKSASNSVSNSASHSASTPDYTLKPRIQKRKVKPFVAEQSAVAAVPYRPTKLGERIGDGAVEAAHEAPQMTGNEELRQDLLGSGATLDNLLDRRRA